MAYNVCGNLKLNKIKVEITKIMNSTEILKEIKNQLEQLEHKGYDKNSFKSGFLLGYAKALQLQQPDVSGRSEQLCGFFEADTKTSSATKCKCGREKWEHPKPRN